MPVKNDEWIRTQSLERGMIEPFSDQQVSAGVVSFGLSSYGYDIRLADEFRIPVDASGVTLDPKRVDPAFFREHRGADCIIAPNSFVLARSLEYFRIPRNILTICAGKSTYARCGVVVNVTPFEPEWEGTATMMLANTGRTPVRVYAGEGIAQLIFLESDRVCRRSYADKKGRYQAQKTITTAFVEKARQ